MMPAMMTSNTLRRLIGFTLLSLPWLAMGCASSPPVVGGEYRADTPFPEFMPMWREGWPWKDETGQRMKYAYDGMPLGGYAFATFRNTTDEPLTVQDVLLEGVSLTQAVAPEHPPKGTREDKYRSSIQLSKLPKEEIDRLVTAGEPVWWKAEPATIAPGGYGQVTVRLRRDPKIGSLTFTIPSLPTDSNRIKVSTAKRQPRFFSLNFTPEFDAVYAYLRHPSGKGVAPDRILLDGRDVTAACTIAADPRIDTVPVVIRPQQPFEVGSWHAFQAVYADGTTARVGLRAWQPGLVYGMWGYSNVGKTKDENRKLYLEDMRVHNINTLLYSIPGEVREFLRTAEGQEYSRQTEIRAMTNWAGDAVNAPFMFLSDEPDASDFASKMLDPYKRLGGLGQWLVERAELFRKEEPGTPVLLNVDNTYKPENWYTYGQLTDLPCADPYYQEAVQSVLASDPTNWAPYLKPTYVYGVGTIYGSASAPKPMHLILHTCRLDIASFPYRAPTPEEKRIEAYYAMAAGAKALSYWWYTPAGEYYGCGGNDPASKALWKELGLVGAELRSAEPLIIRSCPAVVPTEAPRMLWVRTLLAGDDALAVIVVNDNFSSDRLGTVIHPVENAVVKLQAPSWLNPAEIFELTKEGTRDVKWDAKDGATTLDLNTVAITRLVLISKTPGLRERIQRRYEDKFAANVKALLAAPATAK